MAMIEDGSLTLLWDIDVRRLSDIYDTRDTFLSLYLPVGSFSDARRNDTFIEKRLRTMRKVLGKEMYEEVRSNIERVRDLIDPDPIEGEKGRIIFSSLSTDLLEQYRIPVTIERKLVLDTSPYLLPLAILRDDILPYGVVMVDSRSSKLVLVRSGTCESIDSSSIDLMNKHKMGGMSQRRFQRLREGAIGHFLKGVIDDMESFASHDGLRGIIIAGPGEAKKQLFDMLPPHLKDMVISVMDWDMDMPCGEIIESGDEISKAHEIEWGKELVDELRSDILRGDSAAFGPADVRRALEKGKVRDLLILKGTNVPGWLCESCQNLRKGKSPPSKCPRCGSPLTQVDFVEELYELSQRTGAHIDFIDSSPFMESIGGIGAILRY